VAVAVAAVMVMGMATGYIQVHVLLVMERAPSRRIDAASIYKGHLKK
jgi:hypothetical protein